MPLNPVPSAADLFAKCTPAYGLGSQRCGGLTMADISPTTGLDLESIYADEDGKYRVIGALLESDFLGKSCQIQQNTLYDFIMATARMWDSGKKVGMQRRSSDVVEVFPFIQMARTGIINANYWNVTEGDDTAGTSPGGVAFTHSFVVASQTSIPADTRWFSAKTEIYINGASAGGSVTRTQWTILDAVLVDATHVRIYCKSVNALSSLNGAKLELPVTGVATRGIPNVNDYESYCAQIPSINANQRALFWIQDTRWTVCVDEQTEKLIEMIRANNPLYREFGDVDSVKVNQQILADFQRRTVETFFWNKPLENQTINGYPQLEEITAGDGTSITDYLYLPGISGRVVGRRANAVGIYEQLAECGQVYDLEGEVLNIPELLGKLYIIKRHREDNNIPSDIIEIVVDSAYAVNLRQGFFRYMNSRYEGALRVNVNQESLSKKTSLGFKYTDIEVDYPAGLTVRIVTHRAFDDLLDAHSRSGSGLESGGRMALILDLGNTMYLSILESNSQSNVTGDINQLSAVNEDALCRMKIPRKRQNHKSMKFTIVVECPGASLWIENIGAGIPEHCGPVGDATDLKGDQV